MLSKRLIPPNCFYDGQKNLNRFCLIDQKGTKKNKDK